MKDVKKPIKTFWQVFSGAMFSTFVLLHFSFIEKRSQYYHLFQSLEKENDRDPLSLSNSKQINFVTSFFCYTDNVLNFFLIKHCRFTYDVKIFIQKSLTNTIIQATNFLVVLFLIHYMKSYDFLFTLLDFSLAGQSYSSTHIHKEFLPNESGGLIICITCLQLNQLCRCQVCFFFFF